MNKKNLTRETFWKEKLPVVLFYISLLCVAAFVLGWNGADEMVEELFLPKSVGSDGDSQKLDR